jgi:DNA-binding GntR family transcriptional regulator
VSLADPHAPEPFVPAKVLSVEETVYQQLRLDIGRLRFAPSERLRLESLAARYEVSMTPVRHALRRLESEGLVVSKARKGAHVAPLNSEELEEIQVMRAGLEGYLAGLGAAQCTDEAIEEMIEHRRELEEAYRADDLESYLDGFWSIRDACYRCADRPRLLRAIVPGRVKVERYLLYLCRDVEAAAMLREPPDQLLDACRARDGAAAESSTRRGYLWVYERLSEMLADPAQRAGGVVG